jgi:hypothetical protein
LTREHTDANVRYASHVVCALPAFR